MAASYILTLLALLSYEIQVHIAMMLFGLSEVLQQLARYIDKDLSNTITVEFTLGITLILIAICIALLKCRKNKQDISLKSLLNLEYKPSKLPITIMLMIVAMIFIVVTTMTLSYINTGGSTTLLSMSYVILPIFILLLSFIPNDMVIYLRVVYYSMWIAILGMASQVNIASPVGMVEPFMYLLTLILARWTSIKQTSKLSLEKDKDKGETKSNVG